MVHQDLLERLDHAIEQHKQYERSETYLSKAVNLVLDVDDDNLQALEKMRKEVSENKPLGSDPYAKTDRLIDEDKDARFWQGQINALSSTFLKTTFLFIPGGTGIGGTLVTSALDRARPADSIGTQLLDASLGAASGGATRALLGAARQFRPNPVLSGAITGWGSHVIDVTSRRETYINPETGKTDAWAGMKAIGRSSLSGDAFYAMGASAVLSGMNYPVGNLLSNHALSRSPIARNAFAGFVFGSVSGASGELYRQYRSGEKTNVDRAIGVGLLNGAVAGAGAMTAGVVIDRIEALKHRGDARIPIVDENDLQMYKRYVPKDSELANFYSDHKDSLVRIRNVYGDGFIGKGTGFFVDKDGTIVTAKHVVALPKTGELTIETSDGRKLPATLVATDQVQDLAVIKVNQAQAGKEQLSQPGQFKPIALSSETEMPKFSSPSISLGFAHGAKEAYASVGKYIGETQIQSSSGNGLRNSRPVYSYSGITTTGPGLPGQSGGPMFSFPSGRLIGVLGASSPSGTAGSSAKSVLDLLKNISATPADATAQTK